MTSQFTPYIKFIVALFITMLLIVPVFADGELSTSSKDISTGSASTDKTAVSISAGKMIYTDKQTTAQVSVDTKIDGVIFTPISTTKEGTTDLKLTTGGANPNVSFIYKYVGDTLKETIVLKEDKVLSFPVTINKGFKMIPWDNGKWKIVSNSGNTMDGIVAQKPFGTDANGNYIEMSYSWDGSALTLNYDRSVKIYNKTKTLEDQLVLLQIEASKNRTEPFEGKQVVDMSKPLSFDILPITYPLTIDPTWVSYSGHWRDTSQSGVIIEMWNVSGISSWAPPVGVTSVEYMVVGGGAGGGSSVSDGAASGGGGAGGYKAASNFTVSGTINVTVGAGGSGGSGGAARGNNGGYSNFSTIWVNGGGAGGGYGTVTSGLNGGSGGGSSYGGAVGSGYAGEGNNGGTGTASLAFGGGGGGASTGTGFVGSTTNGGNGGTGTSNSITGTAAYYAAGGGGGVYSSGAAGGNGGSYIGGNGGDGSVGLAAVASTGSGGGGAGSKTGSTTNGGAGSSGIVIIKYLVPNPVTFSYTPSSGIEPLQVQFNETSSGVNSPTTFEWQAYNTSGNNTKIVFSTIQNASFVFPVGNWLIKSNVSNASYTNTSIQISYVNVSLKEYDKWYLLSDGHWLAFNGTETVEMWNGTGSYLWNTPTDVDSTKYLVVGGGGGGGSGATRGDGGSGGGGAGGYLENTTQSLSIAGTYTIIVGGGGNGAPSGVAAGTRGVNSSFGSIVAVGGGYGASYEGAGYVAVVGGSGGGGGSAMAAANGITNQGNAGAAGSGGSPYYGGGGGGAANAGAARVGGIGKTSSIGLGAATNFSHGGNSTFGASAPAATTAKANTGRGGDGNGGTAGSSGGSGIVIIRYQPNVVSSFTYSPSSGISQVNSIFNDTSSGNPTAWQWNWTGYGTNTTSGIFSTTNNASASFLPGNYKITLKASTYRASNISTQNSWVNVSAPEIFTGFTANQTSGLFPLPVTFNVTKPSDNATLWNWSFGDGTWQNGTSQNATKIYSTGGTYTVSELASFGAYSNTTTITNMITVYNRTYITDFTASNVSGIQPLIVKFTPTTSNATTYNWSFGDGNVSSLESPTFTYNVPGTYSVNFSVSNGQHSSWYNKSNYIVVSPIPYTVAAFTSNVTVGLNYGMYVNFSDTSSNSPTSWFWDFGDGGTSTLQNPQYVYDVARLYNVSLRATNAYGSDWENKTNYINLTTDLPYVGAWSHFDGANGGTIFIDEIGSAISSSGATTSSNQVKFGNASLYTSAGWNFISTPNSSRNWFGNGAFTLEGWMYPTSTGAGNELWQSKTNRFLSQGWGLYHGNSSTASNDWHFFMGDSATNSTSAFTIPLNTWTHVAIQRYTNGTVFIYLNGNYTTSKSMSGIFDTSNPYRIGRQGTGANSNSFVGYTDEARGSNIVRWFGNFTPPTEAYRDGTTIPDINPSSTFRFKTDSGGIADIYNQTNSGVRNRTIQIQNVNNATYIVGSMTYDQDHLFLKNIYANTSTWSDITIVSYTIFNDGGLLEFNLTRPGGFAPGTSRASVLDTQMLYWNYTQYPTSSSGFFGFGVLINGSTGETYPVHNFIETVLTYGGWDFYPNFTSNVTTGFAPLSVQFNDTTIGYPNIWNWSWGDGTWTNGSAINAPVHTYTSVGNYTVNMSGTIWQNMSVVNSTSKTNYIQVTEPSPVANFTQNQTTGLYILAVQFNDTSSNTPKSWNWSFGDGTLSTLQNPVKVFSTGGLYQINLTVNNSNATYSTKLSSVEVWNRTSNTFTANNVSGNVSLYTTFTDVSTNATSWFWDFGNGNTSTTKSPSFVYTTVGTYSINHSSSNPNHTFWFNRSNYITVYPPFVSAPIAAFTGTPTSGYIPLNVTFTSTSSGDPPLTYNWSFGDGNYSTSATPTYGYYTAGTYTVNLTVTNSAGTNTTSRVNYITAVFPKPIVDFSTNTTFGFIPLSVQFFDNSTGYLPSTWNWSFGEGNYSNLQNPVFIYTNYGLYTIVLNVSNAGGYNSTTKVNYINATAVVFAPVSSFVMNVSSGAPPLGVSFTDTSINGATVWNYSFGDGNYSSLQNPTHLYSTEGIYTISQNVSNAFGFNKSTQKLIVTDVVIGGGSGGGTSSSSSGVWIEPNTTLAVTVMGLPGAVIVFWLAWTGRQKASRRREDY